MRYQIKLSIKKGFFYQSKLLLIIILSIIQFQSYAFKRGMLREYPLFKFGLPLTLTQLKINKNRRIQFFSVLVSSKMPFNTLCLGEQYKIHFIVYIVLYKTKHINQLYPKENPLFKSVIYNNKVNLINLCCNQTHLLFTLIPSMVQPLALLNYRKTTCV